MTFPLLVRLSIVLMVGVGACKTRHETAAVPAPDAAPVPSASASAPRVVERLYRSEDPRASISGYKSCDAVSGDGSGGVTIAGGMPAWLLERNDRCAHVHIVDRPAALNSLSLAGSANFGDELYVAPDLVHAHMGRVPPKATLPGRLVELLSNIVSDPLKYPTVFADRTFVPLIQDVYEYAPIEGCKVNVTAGESITDAALDADLTPIEACRALLGPTVQLGEGGGTTWAQPKDPKLKRWIIRSFSSPPTLFLSTPQAFCIGGGVDARPMLEKAGVAPSCLYNY